MYFGVIGQYSVSLSPHSDVA